MLQRFNPDTVPPPFSRYAQAIAVPAGYRWLHISGQVGCDLDKKIALGFEAQADLAWRHVVALLQAAGMEPRDLVKVTVLLTRAEDVAASRIVRDRHLDGAEPASTLMIVAGLAHPDLLIEVEAIAARPAV